MAWTVSSAMNRCFKADWPAWPFFWAQKSH